MTLSIDTSDNRKIIINIGDKTKKLEIEEGFRYLKSEKCLLLVDELLKENNLQFKEINAIKVNTGPGSFTGLRVGITIANALAFLLKIPVNNKKIGDLIFPVYN